ncbi:hypothetical protein [Timonella sp. A28]|uniref:hypothetical protein n=1 Tax=Timonella sp. A28 TaxID=3442640 RepID=UPI003EC081CA
MDLDNLSKYGAPVVVSVLSLVVVASGCSLGESKIPAAEALGEAEYALCFSEQSRDIVDDGEYGKVVLVNEGGGMSQVSTQGMDVCSMAWADKGLFFSDRSADFRVDADGVTRFDSPKTDSQYSMLAVSPDTAVGLYNYGFTDGGYTTQVVTTTSSGSTLKEVEGGYYTWSQCDGTVFGMGEATGPYSVTGEPDTEPILLNQVTGTADGKEKNIGSTRMLSFAPPVPDAPCVDGKILFISDARDDTPGAPAQPVLSIWDTTTGAYEQIALDSDPALGPLLQDDGTGGPQTTAHSVRNGKIEWFGAENSIMSTDLKTGHTEQLFTVEGHISNSAFSSVMFTEKEVIIMVDNNDDSKFRIIRYDRDTGKELKRTVLDMPPHDVSEGYFYRNFAVRP